MSKIPRKVKQALALIKGYCGKHFVCGDCPLEDFCKLEFTNPPIDWNWQEDDE